MKILIIICISWFLVDFIFIDQQTILKLTLKSYFSIFDLYALYLGLLKGKKRIFATKDLYHINFEFLQGATFTRTLPCPCPSYPLTIAELIQGAIFISLNKSSGLIFSFSLSGLKYNYCVFKLQAFINEGKIKYVNIFTIIFLFMRAVEP